MNDKIEYKRIETIVRPPRCAILINETDKNWQQSLLRIIEKFSFYWGGLNNLIIPTDGKRIKKEFWKILENYYPDYLNVYIKLNEDYKKANPFEFENFLKEQVNIVCKEHNIPITSTVSKEIEDSILRSVDLIEKFNISSELRTELINKVNPFFHNGNRDFGMYNGYSNIDLNSILDNYSEAEKKVEDFIFKFNEPIVELLFRSYIGSSSFIKENKETRKWYSSIKKEDDIIYETKEIEKNNFYDLITLAKNNKSNTPYNLINRNLFYYYHHKNRSSIRTLIVVCGDTVDDFCLYYSLKSLLSFVIWMPICIINKANENNYDNIFNFSKNWVTDNIEHYLSDWLFDKNIILTSFSCNKDITKKIQSIIEDNVFFHRDITLTFRYPSELNDFYKNSLYVCEKRELKDSSVEPFIGNYSVDYLKTPIPKSFEKINAYDYHWIVDVIINSPDIRRNPKDGYYLPPLPIYTKDVFAEDSNYNNSDFVRINWKYISFTCPHFLITGPDVDSQIFTPRIKLLEPLEIFTKALETINYSAIYSDKGNYMRESIELFGSLENICENISDENVSKMLEQYISNLEGNKRLKKGQEGVSVSQRAYLNFEDIKLFIGDDPQTRKLIDEFLLKRIFNRGYILKCSKCKNSDWYGFNDLKESFICYRCKSEQVFLKEHWREPFEPSIYYKLNEIFYLSIKNNMKVPLLTLNYLKSLSESSFIFSPELELTHKINKKEHFEIDISCVIDGELYIGEAKKTEEIPEKLNIYNTVCNELNARFVLSTLAENWGSANIKRIEECSWNKAPLFLTHKEIMNS
jgi:hypothetical protein